MAVTHTSDQMPSPKIIWAREAVRAYRAKSVLTKYMGTDENSIIQLTTEFDSTDSGTLCGIGLVADLSEDGTVGDNTLQGNEEALNSSWIEIELDQLRHAIREKGQLENRKAVLKTRPIARERLGYWRAKTMDSLVINTLSGVSWAYNTDGSLRATGRLASMKSAARVTPPSANRGFNFNGTDLMPADTTAINSTCVLKYAAMVQSKAIADTKGIKTIKVGNKEFHLFFCHPMAYAQLKSDADFRNAILHGQDRGPDNAILSGAEVTIDGLLVVSNLRAFNTLGALAGAKWGASGNVNGTRSLLLGAQALALGDIWAKARWSEKDFDYDNQIGYAIALMFGMTKTKYPCAQDGGLVEDFGVITINSYLGGGATS